MDPVFPLEIFLRIAIQTPYAFMMISRLSVNLRNMLRDPAIQARIKAAFARTVQIMDAMGNRVVCRQLPNGTLHGQLRRYAGMAPYEITDYADGRKHGQSTIFYVDGGVSSISHYVGGQLHGIRAVYYKNGYPRYSLCYHRGYKHGLMREYREDGSISYETDYVYNVRRESRSYDIGGKLVSVRNVWDA